MFRWPVEFTPLSFGSRGVPHGAILEVTPRGAVFTLAALSHLGHPAHLALIDAHLKGQVRVTSTTGIGEDCRIVASSLAAPLLAAFELGVEHLTLADLVFLLRDAAPSTAQDRAADGHPTITPDSPHFLLRTGHTWLRVQGAERFESPGCLGTLGVGRPEPWHRIIAELSDDGRMLAELREPSSAGEVVTPATVTGLRGQALATFGRRADARCINPANDPADAAHVLAGPVRDRRPCTTSFPWQGLTIEAVLTPDADGYQTLCLLPPAGADPVSLPGPMLDATRELIVGIIRKRLPEERTEPIALRLMGQDGRSTTLDIGVSVVIVRNQTVFAAWVGSDGRVMIKLLPPGGMPTR